MLVFLALPFHVCLPELNIRVIIGRSEYVLHDVSGSIGGSKRRKYICVLTEYFFLSPLSQLTVFIVYILW